MDTYQLQTQLLNWYQKNKRDLPWRQGKDPYHIWVSEVMLQQTKVETVIPYYERFIKQYPTIEALSDAPEEEVLKSWEGLGYYSRARNLQKGVKEVKERYKSKVPNKKDEIIELTGIGPYTAGAILSIAYNKNVPAVDGNVMRVIARIYNLSDDVAKARTRIKIEGIVEKIIPEHYPSDFNQALMELGALICIPKTPKCVACPLTELCEGKHAGNQYNLPIKAKKKPPKPVYRVSIVIQTEDHIVLVKRPNSGLLANMWELPSLESESPLSTDEWEENLYQSYGISINLVDAWMNVQHTFSHLHWNLDIYHLIDYVGELPPHFTWIKKDQLSNLSFPKAYQEAIKRLRTI